MVKEREVRHENYNPIKPKDLTYSGTFDKSGTWSTTTVGASYSKQFECKWGNETLVWTLKKMVGLVDVYLDDKKVGSYECYSKSAQSEQITISKT